MSEPVIEPVHPPVPPIIRLALPRSRAVAVWVILGLNVLVWLGMLVLAAQIAVVESGGQILRYPARFLSAVFELSTSPEVLIAFGAKFNPLIVGGQVWRLFTPVLVHIGLIHLLFNCYAIYIIAPPIEEIFGTARFLAVYLLSGAFGVLFSFIMSPHLSAGASGAIFGLIGTQAVFFYRYRHVLGRGGQRQFQNTIGVILFNLIMTFAVPGIDVWGHLGGLLTGALLGWWIMPDYEPTMTAGGPMLVDRRTRRRWGRVVLIAVSVFVMMAWLAIRIRQG